MKPDIANPEWRKNRAQEAGERYGRAMTGMFAHLTPKEKEAALNVAENVNFGPDELKVISNSGEGLQNTPFATHQRQYVKVSRFLQHTGASGESAGIAVMLFPECSRFFRGQSALCVLRGVERFYLSAIRDCRRHILWRGFSLKATSGANALGVFDWESK